LGVPLGVASAFRVKSRFDKVISGFFNTMVSIPIFILGLLGIIIFASTLKWTNVLPKWSEPKYWILPVALLAIIPLANMIRLTRAAMLNAMGEEYIRTARAKGLSRRQAMWKHVLPNAMITVLTFLTPILMELMAASFIIEGIFGFPGFGREYWDSIGDLDYSMIMSITFIYAFGITLANLLLDTLYSAIDPRMRAG
jgi:ABC-type dipeptide/oligopeptide/nickel transport system permease component